MPIIILPKVRQKIIYLKLVNVMYCQRDGHVIGIGQVVGVHPGLLSCRAELVASGPHH